MGVQDAQGATVERTAVSSRRVDRVDSHSVADALCSFQRGQSPAELFGIRNCYDGRPGRLRSGRSSDQCWLERRGPDSVISVPRRR